MFVFFFFQGEDGIRDSSVTGVQTCALPIYREVLRYQPPHAPLAEFLTIARRLGFERFVFVQPSAYGLDNACMLDAMDELDPAIRRGIVHLDEATARDADLARWHDIGVRGVRINTSPIRKPEAGRARGPPPNIVRTRKSRRAVCLPLGLI